MAPSVPGYPALAVLRGTRYAGWGRRGGLDPMARTQRPFRGVWWLFRCFYGSLAYAGLVVLARRLSLNRPTWPVPGFPSTKRMLLPGRRWAIMRALLAPIHSLFARLCWRKCHRAHFHHLP